MLWLEQNKNKTVDSFRNLLKYKSCRMVIYRRGRGYSEERVLENKSCENRSKYWLLKDIFHILNQNEPKIFELEDKMVKREGGGEAWANKTCFSFFRVFLYTVKMRRIFLRNKIIFSRYGRSNYRWNLGKIFVSAP